MVNASTRRSMGNGSSGQIDNYQTLWCIYEYPGDYPKRMG